MINFGTPPPQWQSKTGSHRAVRGGSWNNSPGNARAAYRNERHRDNRNQNLGFRLALSSCAAAGSGRKHVQDQVAPAGLWCSGDSKAKVLLAAKRKGPGVLVEAAAVCRCHERSPGVPLTFPHHVA